MTDTDTGAGTETGMETEPKMETVDLVQGFLELVGDPSGIENSESYELQSLKLEQARETSPPTRF